MAVTREHLHKGGRVYYRVQIPRPGAQAESRLKPARVVDVERGAATIRLLEETQTSKVKFCHLEPDVDYLASLERNARPLTHSMRSYLKSVAVDKLANEQAPAPPELPPPVVEAEPEAPPAAPEAPPAPASDDLQAYLEMGKDLRARLDQQILTAAAEQVGPLMAKRAELESQIINTKRPTTPVKEEKSMTPQPRTKYPDEQKAEAIASVDAGMAIKEAAAKHKVGYKSLCAWVAGHEREKRAAAKREKKRAADRKSPTKLASHVNPLGVRYGAKTKADVLAAVDGGATWLEVAEKLKVGYSTVRNWVLERDKAVKAVSAVGRGQRHVSDVKALVLEAVDGGTTWSAAAKKFGVPYSTVRTWAHVERAAAVEPGAVSKAPPSTGIVVMSGGDTTLRENKRLRATLAMVLQRTNAAESGDTLRAQNERLQVVIDLLLGVE